jgi:CheY-like chemotaxis protein
MAHKKILVVDDQEEILSLLKDFLTQHDFAVTTTKEPKTVVNRVKSLHPDIILLDLLMPNLGGFDICEILNSDPETRGIPIIAMSGLNDLVDIKKAYKLGIVGYLAKPFALDELLREVNKCLANKEQLH